MTKRALVLGGGGTLGVAWEMGVAAGLHEGGVDPGTADLIIGTSAGSVTGAMLAFGMDPLTFMAMQAAGVPASSVRDLTCRDPRALEAVRTLWTGAQQMTAELRRQVGAMALAAQTVSEHDWVGSISDLLGGLEEWPDRPLLITAVDARSGDGVVWEKKAGVPLYQAVASSCAVPGLFPPVSIKGGRYTDGGVRSGTNADLAAGYESVLILAPMGGPEFALGNRQLLQEAQVLRAAGSLVEVLVPDQAAIAAFGPDLMDASRIVGAAEAGVRQGKHIAERVAPLWG